MDSNTGYKTGIRCVLLMSLAVYHLIDAIAIDNGVVGEVEIECSSSTIAANFKTAKAFKGRTFVKGYSKLSECARSGSSSFTNPNSAKLELNFDSECVSRRRSANPKGIFVDAVVVISFHRKFITKVDRAYLIRCFYMEVDKTVSVGFTVSMMPTRLQTSLVTMPQCSYEILQPDANGDAVGFGVVGQKVYHKWTCTSDLENTFCMQVKSCFVEDGNSGKDPLVDSDGCSLDIHLLNNIEYPTDLMAGVEVHVFKFADEAQLYFQCQIQIDVKEDPTDSCLRPTCSSLSGSQGRRRRQASDETEATGSTIIDVGVNFDALAAFSDTAQDD